MAMGKRPQESDEIGGEGERERGRVLERVDDLGNLALGIFLRDCPVLLEHEVKVVAVAVLHDRAKRVLVNLEDVV